MIVRAYSILDTKRGLLNSMAPGILNSIQINIEQGKLKSIYIDLDKWETHICANPIFNTDSSVLKFDSIDSLNSMQINLEVGKRIFTFLIIWK